MEDLQLLTAQILELFLLMASKIAQSPPPPKTENQNPPLLFDHREERFKLASEFSKIAAGLYEAPVTTLDISQGPSINQRSVR